MVKRCLGMLYVSEDDPDYNLIVRTMPVKHEAEGVSNTQDWWRWHVEVIVRITFMDPDLDPTLN